jgi:hypothetical protein
MALLLIPVSLLLTIPLPEFRGLCDVASQPSKAILAVVGVKPIFLTISPMFRGDPLVYCTIILPWFILLFFCAHGLLYTPKS